MLHWSILNVFTDLQFLNKKVIFFEHDLKMFPEQLGAAPAGSPLAEDEDEDDPEVLENDVPDLRSFALENLKQ